MSGWYELKQSSDGQFRFSLKDGDGRSLLNSEGYKSKEGAKDGMASVQKNAADGARYERLEAQNGTLYFTLKAANHQIIGTSPMYGSAAERDAAMAATQATGATSSVRESN